MRRFLEVITPAASLDLTVLDTAKTHLNVTGTSLDTKIQNWIKQASDAIASHCSRVFGQETVKETFFVSIATDALVLERYPVSSIASVSVDGTVLAGADYMIDKAKGILSRISGDSLGDWGKSKVEVTYVGGYVLLSGLPYDIEQACLRLVQYAYSHGSRDPAAKRIEIPDVQTIDYWVGGMGAAGELPPDVLALLAPYTSYRL